MKKFLFRWHSRIALLAFLPLILIATTGSVLVFKDDIDILLRPHEVELGHIDFDENRLDVDTLIKHINEAFPRYALSTWEMFDDRITADRIYFLDKKSSEWFKAYLDPYKGELLSNPVPLHHDLTDFILSLHYTLLLKNTGLGIASIISLLFIFLGVSGLIIYGKFWKRLLTLRLDKKLVIWFSDLHKMFGLFASPILLILGITGAYFNIAEFIDETIGHEHEHITHVEPYNITLSVESMLKTSTKRIETFTPSYLVLPFESDRDFMVLGDVNSHNPLNSQYASGFTFDRQTGELKQQWDVREQGFVAVTLDSFRRLHFGNFAGLFSKVLWFVGGLVPLILSITGVTLWWKRRKKRHHTRVRRSNVLNLQTETKL